MQIINRNNQWRRIANNITILFLLFSFCKAYSQDSSVIQFTQLVKRVDRGKIKLIISAKIPKGVKLYSIKQNAGIAIHSSFQFDSSTQKLFQDSVITEKGNKSETDDRLLKTHLFYFEDSVLLEKLLYVSAIESINIKGVFNYVYQKDGLYDSGEERIKFFVHLSAVESNNSGMSAKSLLWIFIAAFGGGLLALFTPCVYSMIPVTVSFFTKRSTTNREGKKNAIYYAASIIIIFTLIGFLVTLVFGPSSLNNLATNWIANLIFFALFLVFGISFLGSFEITLPSSWSTRADSKAGMGSFAGIFFMALTLVVVSFSCTGPIIGNLLVLAAKGNFWGPLTGMFGFSLALSLPFALFAFFPGKLNVLGKAGGWLNTIKVTLGFLELALALKFLSNADLSKGWRLLDREIFLSLWIVIFILLGIYLLGKLKFHHDDDLKKNDFGVPFLSVTRLIFAIIVLTFAVYMIPGLWGAPLKSISAFIPPMGTQDFTTSSNQLQQNDSLPGPVKYADKMKIYEPEVVTKYGMITYFDYEEALAIAKKLKRPLMLDFTGINCVNCRKMEGQVWSDAQVMKRLKEDFVIVSLYVDVNNIDLPEQDIYFSKVLHKKIETLGAKNADIQVTKFGANSQPYYFFLDGNEKKLVEVGYGYNPDIQKFIEHLDNVKTAFIKANLNRAQ